jgi:hypothetical protein
MTDLGSLTYSLSPRGRGRGPLRKQWEGDGVARRCESPLTFPRLRRGPLPLPQGERGIGGTA